MRLYVKEGKSQTYFRIKNEFEQAAKAANQKYIQKLKQEVIEGKRGSSYSAMRKLGVRESEAKSSLFDLPQHLEENLTPTQSAERIADFFSSTLLT